MIRREVVLDPGVLHLIAEQLPSRAPDGVPTFTDFLLHELPTLAHILRERFDETTLPTERDGVRVLLSNRILFHSVTVYLRLDARGRVHIADIAIEPYEAQAQAPADTPPTINAGSGRAFDRNSASGLSTDPRPAGKLTPRDLDAMTPDERTELKRRLTQPLAESEISESLKDRIEATSARLAEHRAS